MKLIANKKALSLAVGTAFGASLALSPAVMADSNPFATSELNSGYMQLAGGHMGEGKCGGDKG